MRFRWKYTQILIILIFTAFVYYLVECEGRYIPIFILRLLKTPTRLRRSSCPSDSKSEQPLTFVQSSMPRYVVHKPIGGRIGNKLFQLAATVGIAHSLNAKPYIDINNPLLEYFEIAPSEQVHMTNMLTLSEDDCRHEVWKCRKETHSHNLTITGYLQSWKHFDKISHVIRKLFTIKPTYRSKARSFIESKIPRNRTIIGLHVRRTDTRTISDMIGGYTGAEMSYISKGMSLYRKEFKNPVFLVVSDDITWCKENIVDKDVVFSEFEEPILDLTLLSMCNHTLMTIGTFGWWGGWLAGGKVVYLNDWPRPGSWLDLYAVVKEEFFRPEWIGLGN